MSNHDDVYREAKLAAAARDGIRPVFDRLAKSWRVRNCPDLGRFLGRDSCESAIVREQENHEDHLRRQARLARLRELGLLESY